MSGRRSARMGRARAHLAPLVESLDRRELMATTGGLTSSLGAYVVPSPSGPPVTETPTVVNPRTSINSLLTQILGPGLAAVQAASPSLGASPQAVLKQTVVNQSFVHSVLSNSSAYTLFGSSALSSLLGSVQASGLTTSDAAATTTTTTNTSGATTSVTTSAADPLIAFSIPGQATIQSTDATTTIIQVNPLDGVAGFVVSVPNANLRISSEGPPVTGSVLIPQSSLPTGFPIPTTSVLSIGTFSPTYVATAPVLDQILNAKVKAAAPNAPSSVPGLRLASFLLHHDPFPSQSASKTLVKALNLAVQRNVFALDSAQMSTLTAGITQFATQVQGLITAGSFTPSVPTQPPSLPTGSLSGTLEVSAGVVTQLLDVNPAVTGLALPALGNFPGRLDVGYVFDRSGNFGIILTLQGPLQNANPVPTPTDVVSGDVRVEVSNASNISDLTGQRVVEGVEVGSGASSDLGDSEYTNGIKTFSASSGNGFGLEYGTGVAYSTVIPLGNVFALLPASPPT